LRSPGSRGLARFIACSLLSLILLPLPFAPAAADSGDTLQLVRSRGAVRCGVSEGIQGFSIRDAAGNWSGIDVDFCRAVASAVLGDPSKVRFVPLIATARFPSIASREIDILSRNTTWTIIREAAFSILFVGVMYYDAQGFIVHADGPFAHSANLDGAKLCVENGSNQLAELRTYAKENNWRFTTVMEPGLASGRDAFAHGVCAVLMDDMSALHELLLRLPDPSAYAIRPETFSQSPLGPAVRWDDGQWVALVRAVHAALIDAEARGLTQDDARKLIKGQPDPAHVTYLDETGAVGRNLGISPLWAALAVASVGNYGEIFARNLGPGTPLKLDRGVNKPWTQGGLLYAPPFQ
jgi:general L-amino acid transport system substrate-binding protein